MRVPPAQSSTAAATRASATSTSRCARWRVTLVSRVPKTSVCTRCAVVGDRVQEVQQHARVADPSSPRCRTARPAAAAGSIRLRYASGVRSRAAPVMRRSVVRRSMRAPARDRTRAALRQLAAAAGAGARASPWPVPARPTVIVAKSFVCSTSRAENVCAASRSMSSSSSSGGARLAGCSACARRDGSGARLVLLGRGVPAPAAAARPPSSRAAAGSSRRARRPGRRAAGAPASTTSTAASAARKSSRRAIPTASTAASASITFAGPSGNPAARNSANEVQHVLREVAAASGEGEQHGIPSRRDACLRLGHEARRDLRRRCAPMSSWYLSSTPSVSFTVAGRARCGRAPRALRPSRASRRRPAA